MAKSLFFLEALFGLVAAQDSGVPLPVEGAVPGVDPLEVMPEGEVIVTEDDAPLKTTTGQVLELNEKGEVILPLPAEAEAEELIEEEAKNHAEPLGRLLQGTSCRCYCNGRYLGRVAASRSYGCSARRNTCSHRYTCSGRMTIS
uniref:Uncharacterized protein n=1 Tax=Chromera velia CCMP2878 TaxID=1169474 RepID=A0A0G4ICI5_9ALVE|mmetsp:Transcript_52983/g.103641  ORF Transcript_52983/g.103641 Transcript_52983/m.103641 type:complete len:144 (+) Transcript_52983:177-608(+)|eukprot:Cvel_13130.t1-p1 / transcript=Cvel_13130.t1 / gene=Cvel_13130 / organism=Chromera_velia_CCMP2878 / gene_product=hypothetical protein / transcript_product=hypothetical protein / location=Cvel_scaffold885:32617-33045(-) / protein_length=143 / sequence_SO=supercontig / SO=protein_coding / is_pseudo=false